METDALVGCCPLRRLDWRTLLTVPSQWNGHICMYTDWISGKRLFSFKLTMFCLWITRSSTLEKKGRWNPVDNWMKGHCLGQTSWLKAKLLNVSVEMEPVTTECLTTRVMYGAINTMQSFTSQVGIWSRLQCFVEDSEYFRHKIHIDSIKLV